jgi:hypothetical protein
MKKAAFSLLLMLAVPAAWAQRDSSKIDIGWLSLDKGLTQTISIKGADLEKMPFVNLSDAIAAWLYGAYTQPGVLAYVVDGNPVADVNMYPIFDIEEVTLVENATAAAAYGGTQQELVVIRTKRGAGAAGMRAAAQGGLVNADGDGRHTYTNAYHQYYLGAYRNLDKLSFGGSADWIRDVNPVSSGPNNHVTIPDNLQRWRLNGWLTWRPGKGNTVELRMGYAPQVMKELVDSANAQALVQIGGQRHSHVLVPQLRWRGEWFPGLSNDLQAVYLVSSATEHDSELGTSPTSNGFNYSAEESDLVSKQSQLLLRDRLAYDLDAGGWHIAPALNFSYEHIVEKEGYATQTVSASGSTIISPFLPPESVEFVGMQKGDLSVLTPAIDFRRAQAVDLQAGAQGIFPQRADAGRTLYPFATLGVDLLHLGSAEAGRHLKVFVSYAQRPLVFVNDYALTDFNGGGAVSTLNNMYYPRGSYRETTYSYSNGGVDSETVTVNPKAPPVCWTGETGVSYSTADGRLQVQYVFERRNYYGLGASTLGLYSLAPAYAEWKSSLQHIDVRFKALASKTVNWLTGVEVTLLRSKLDSNGAQPSLAPEAGDMSPAPLSWTGGWVNRLQIQRFTAGLDLLFHVGEEPLFFNGEQQKQHSITVPNVYAGYRWKLAKAGELELFVEGRGLVRNKSNDLLDDRRYYTVGGNFTL